MCAQKRYPDMHVMCDAIPSMLAYWDRNLICRFANRPYLEWFGRSPEELIDFVTLKQLLGEEVYALNEPYVLGVLGGTTQTFERTLTKQDGTIHYTLANYIPDVNSIGTVVGFFVLVTDITPLKEAESELRLAASIYSSIESGVMVTDTDGLILMVNPAFTRITGYSAGEAIGQKPSILSSGRQDKAFYTAMWQGITDKGRWEGELWNRRKNGEAYLEQLTINVTRDEAGAPVRNVALFNDITAIWQKDERLRHLAFHDALTDLPNRSLLMELLGRQIALATREGRQLAVLFLDLDGFKVINDSLGHVIGDELLKAVARCIRASIRQVDIVARLGGDEFVILLDNPEDRDVVARIAKLIITAINDPVILQGAKVGVGASIGIAEFPQDGDTPASLLANADTAMYAAKKSGKNSFRFFDSAMPCQES